MVEKGVGITKGRGIDDAVRNAADRALFDVAAELETLAVGDESPYGHRDMAHE